ncbi:MinD/ParA family protein [Bacillus sp. 2205SS5-2]|uniref:MinD/ParA family protein n=1 Tax=Bacillus sp. 2205SS5-2 TaxID=3109031 RepID=UPI003004EE05
MKDQAQGLRAKLKLQSRARTIAVVSGKGGVGKSNIALNFSTHLAKKNKKVLLMDLDIGMGNIHILMGKNTNKTIMDLLDGTADIKDIVTEGPEGISYIAGGTGLRSFVEWSEDKFEIFTDGMRLLQETYDFILFDMGAGASKESVDLIMTMDEILLITTPEPTSITDAYSLMKFIFFREGKQKVSVICNRAQQISQGNETLRRFQNVIDKFLRKHVSILGTIVEDPNVGRAVREQVPFCLQYPKSAASLGIERIVTLYVNDPIAHHLLPNKPSFVEKLKILFSRGGE